MNDKNRIAQECQDFFMIWDFASESEKSFFVMGNENRSIER